MMGMLIGRTAISVACAAALALGSPALLAQKRSIPPSTELVCRMQQSSDNPNCKPPQSSDAVNLPDRAGTPDAGRASNDGGSSFSVPEVLAALFAAVVTGLLIKELTGSKDMTIRDLERNGPKPPENELLGLYEVQGLVYPRWPLVVEVNAEADATTFVQVVTADGKKGNLPPMVISEGGGQPWGNDTVLYPIETERTARGILAKFELPEELGRGGQDGFHSARLAVASGRMQGGEFTYRPLEVFALGAGPTAVGSAAVEITRFDPAAGSRRANFEITFNARRTFANLNAELIRREQKGRKTKRSRVASQDVCRARSSLDLCEETPPQVPFPIMGSWPANVASQLDPGDSYHMELRAYTGRIRSGGWLVSQAPRVLAWP